MALHQCTCWHQQLPMVSDWKAGLCPQPQSPCSPGEGPPFPDLWGRGWPALKSENPTLPRPVPATPHTCPTPILWLWFKPNFSLISVFHMWSPWRPPVQQFKEGLPNLGAGTLQTSKHSPCLLVFLRQIVGCVFIN